MFPLFFSVSLFFLFFFFFFFFYYVCSKKDAIAVFRGEALLEDDILLLASFSAINTYSVLAKSVLINHESVAGTAAASKKDGSVLELRPSQDCRDDGLWAGQLLANLDRAILAWQRAESKKVSSGLFLQQANVEVEVDDDMSKLLMDERCKSRYPNTIKREGGAIQGARFLAKWVLRPKKMTDLATKEVSVLLTATHHGLLVMVPALGVMFGKKKTKKFIFSLLFNHASPLSRLSSVLARGIFLGRRQEQAHPGLPD